MIKCHSFPSSRRRLLHSLWLDFHKVPLSSLIISSIYNVWAFFLTFEINKRSQLSFQAAFTFITKANDNDESFEPVIRLPQETESKFIRTYNVWIKVWKFFAAFNLNSHTYPNQPAKRHHHPHVRLLHCSWHHWKKEAEGGLRWSENFGKWAGKRKFCSGLHKKSEDEEDSRHPATALSN